MRFLIVNKKRSQVLKGHGGTLFVSPRRFVNDGCQSKPKDKPNIHCTGAWPPSDPFASVTRPRPVNVLFGNLRVPKNVRNRKKD
jgi:hypothetical protein